MKQVEKSRAHGKHVKKKIFVIAMAFCMTSTLLPSAGETAYALESAQIANTLEFNQTESTLAESGQIATSQIESSQLSSDQLSTTANICEPASKPEYKCGYKPANITENLDVEVRTSDSQTSYGGKLRFNTTNVTPIADIGTETRYCRSKLVEANSKLLVIYDAIRDGVNTYAAVIQIENFPSEGAEYTAYEVEQTYYLVREDYPEFFWVDGYEPERYTYEEDASETKYVSKITPTYTFGSLSNTRTAQAKLNNVINTALADLYACNGYGTYSKYDKELWIHDYIAKTTEYDYDEKATNRYTAYGALIDHKVVCEGYTRAFQLLMLKLGIECTTIIGSSDGVNIDHIWNAVKLDDDKWYQVDLTWDDQGTDDFDISYFYCNIPAYIMQTDHFLIGQSNFVDIPECTEVNEWYYFMNLDRVVADEDFDDIDIEALAMNIAEQIVDFGYARILALYNASDISDSFMYEATDGSYVLGTLGEAVLSYMFIDGISHSTTWSFGPEGEEIIFMTYPDEDEGKIYAANVWNMIRQDDDKTDVVIRAYPYNTSIAEMATFIKKEVGTKLTQDYMCKKEAGICSFGILDCAEKELYQAMYVFGAMPLGTYEVAIYKPGTPLFTYTLNVTEGGITRRTAISDGAWWLNRFGDVDDDWDVNALDALILKRHIADWGGAYDEIDTLTANINGDDKVNMEDLLILEKHIAGCEGYEDLSLYYKCKAS